MPFLLYYGIRLTYDSSASAIPSARLEPRSLLHLSRARASSHARSARPELPRPVTLPCRRHARSCRPSRGPMATSTSGASTAATAIKLRDEALAAAQKLEEEAASLHSTNTDRSQQLQMEADLLKSAAAAQDRVRAATDALEKERA